ncbi:MAG TPA: ATP-binding protein [Paucimonas sp.]|nr:ATP-binding protein [Paucimonas sp.]
MQVLAGNDSDPAALRAQLAEKDALLRQAALGEALRRGQGELLEMIAKGAPLKDTLTRLMLLIESQTAGVYCSVLLLDEDGVHIHPGAGPSLPQSYMDALDGYPIGPTAGSCGTAMYRKEAVVVTDILTDPLWAPYKQLLAPHGFRACWSTPIFLNQDVVLGSFAMYHRAVHSPGPDDLKLIGVATHIAGIAIERTRREDELRRHRHHLEELVAERTAELRLAKERAEVGNAALSKANEELAAALHRLSITQAELVRKDKLAALGSLVAGIAHELNTPIGNCLTVASTLADQTRSLAERYAQGIRRSELDRYVGEAGDASALLVRNLQRAADLVASFKQVAVDQTSSQRRTFSLREFAEEVVCTLRPSLRKSEVTLTTEIADGLAMDSFPGPLGQAVANLVGNSFIHGYDGKGPGTIRIAARKAEDGMIELRVEDDGAGIPAANLDRIFDPFFTTRLGAGSSGLGLHITHNIVTGALGGRIHVESAPGAGARFILLLPATAPGLPERRE